MSASDPVRAIETNLFDAWRFLSAIPNVEYHHCPELIRYIGGIPFPLCNSVMRANLPAEAIDASGQGARDRRERPPCDPPGQAGL